MAGLEPRWVCRGCKTALTLPNRVYYNLNMVFREALTNAIRHGDGGRVTVSTRKTRDTLFVTLYNPCGAQFDPRDIFDRGRGLRSMETRTAELGGRFRVRAGFGHFMTRIRVPLDGAWHNREE
jgi:signal transduction histidine kinase